MAIPRLSYTMLESSKRADFDRALIGALTEFGFVVIADPPVDASLLRKAFAKTAQLFALPETVKNKYDSGDGGERGYTAFGRETAKGYDFHDLKEHWHIGREFASDLAAHPNYPQNQWPTEVPEFQQVFNTLYASLEAIAQKLLLSIGRSLDLEADYFIDLTRDGNSVLRLLHYPPVRQSQQGNYMRAAPHADINLMTLLVGASAPGLQLLGRDDQWLEVVSEANDIVVDTGDMMALITNDLLPATIHRVVNPQRQNCSRYSLPFFLHPRSDAVLACHPSCTREQAAGYHPILAGEFLKTRLIENGLLKA